MTFVATVSEHEMGEQPFHETHHDSLGEALAEATYLINRYVFGEMPPFTSLDSWVIVDVAESDSLFEVHYTLTGPILGGDGPGDQISTDYIIVIREH